MDRPQNHIRQGRNGKAQAIRYVRGNRASMDAFALNDQASMEARASSGERTPLVHGG